MGDQERVDDVNDCTREEEKEKTPWGWIALFAIVVVIVLFYPILKLPDYRTLTIGENELVGEQAAEIYKQASDAYTRGNIEEALSYYNKAVIEYTRIIADGDELSQRKLFKRLLADILQRRAECLFGAGKHVEAVQDLDGAVEIYSELNRYDPLGDFTESLAGSYYRRGVIRQLREECEEAIEDQSRAIELYSKLIDDEKNHLKVDNLSIAQSSSTGLSVETVLGNSIPDSTMIILEELGKDFRLAQLEEMKVAALSQRGGARLTLGRFPSGINDLTEALEIGKGRLEENESPKLHRVIGFSYGLRAEAYNFGGEKAKAFDDYNNAEKHLSACVELQGYFRYSLQPRASSLRQRTHSS